MNKNLAAIAILMTGVTVSAQPPGGGPPGGASGDGIWTRNAAFGEAETFDLCNGHQPGSGMYHHHINPVCLRAQLNDNVTVLSTGRLGTQYAEKTTGWTHSPILGWSFDGYPVYGPYGYSNPMDPTSAIKRIQSSFQLRSITLRQTLPVWVLPYEPSVSQTLTTSQYGPPVSASYPLGRYVQDYDYVAGLGDLDQYNGRFTVTPDYPNGTYAYFVTLASDGSPAFPYIFNLQYYGAAASANVTVASDAIDYFNNGALTQTASTDPRLASWYTKGSKQDALAITGFDPSEGASTTWPTNVPSGVTVSGGNSTPALADTQRVRYDAGGVYVNSNNLPSYTIGPWFEATMTAGVFMNWASSLSQLVEITRNPSVPSTKSNTPMGPVGMWVNGAAIFNVLDGASYSNSAGADEGGGGVSPRATNISSASLERGPLAAGSLVSAYAEFDATLATSTATGSPAGSGWPLTLGGATVTVTDSTGAQLPAGILYASPTQVNYQVPSTAASGPGKVTITSGGTSITGAINIAATYPGIFKASADSLAAAQTLTVIGSNQTVASVTATAPINVSTGQVYLMLYGTGIGTAAVTATIGGVNATVAYSGPQGEFGGLDQVNLVIPPSLAGKGKVNVVVTANNKPSNPVYIVIQ
ncbi:MAG TPA: YHYH protein [Bryobacteraceae bacterium]|jgi:uncharacterized protein (TIGR03437 family)